MFQKTSSSRARIAEAAGEISRAKADVAAKNRASLNLANERQRARAEASAEARLADAKAIVTGVTGVAIEHTEAAQAEAVDEVELARAVLAEAEQAGHDLVIELGPDLVREMQAATAALHGAVAELGRSVAGPLRAVDKKLAERGDVRADFDALLRLVPRTALGVAQKREAEQEVKVAPPAGGAYRAGFVLLMAIRWMRQLEPLADAWRELGVEALPGPPGAILTSADLWALQAGESPRL